MHQQRIAMGAYVQATGIHNVLVYAVSPSKSSNQVSSLENFHEHLLHLSSVQTRTCLCASLSAKFVGFVVSPLSDSSTSTYNRVYRQMEDWWVLALSFRRRWFVGLFFTKAAPRIGFLMKICCHQKHIVVMSEQLLIVGTIYNWSLQNRTRILYAPSSLRFWPCLAGNVSNWIPLPLNARAAQARPPNVSTNDSECPRTTCLLVCCRWTYRDLDSAWLLQPCAHTWKVRHASSRTDERRKRMRGGVHGFARVLVLFYSILLTSWHTAVACSVPALSTMPPMCSGLAFSYAPPLAQRGIAYHKERAESAAIYQHVHNVPICAFGFANFVPNLSTFVAETSRCCTCQAQKELKKMLNSEATVVYLFLIRPFSWIVCSMHRKPFEPRFGNPCPSLYYLNDWKLRYACRRIHVLMVHERSDSRSTPATSS